MHRGPTSHDAGCMQPDTALGNPKHMTIKEASPQRGMMDATGTYAPPDQPHKKARRRGGIDSRPSTLPNTSMLGSPEKAEQRCSPRRRRGDPGLVHTCTNQGEVLGAPVAHRCITPASGRPSPLRARRAQSGDASREHQATPPALLVATSSLNNVPNPRPSRRVPLPQDPERKVPFDP